jgi:hypothetical protein
MNDGNLIKSTNNLSDADLNLLREKFVIEYSKKKGWNHQNLKPDQLLEIVEQKGYKHPGIILS